MWVPTRASKSSMTKSSTARCVGLRNTNVNQSQFAEEMLDYAYYKATWERGRRIGVCRRPHNMLV
jgi:hypothetical protein